MRAYLIAPDQQSIGTVEDGATLRDVATDIDDLRRRAKYS